MAKFQLFLESISQAGDVGREISFRITSPSGINKTVGLKTKHRALTEKTPFENSHTVGLEVNATERDSKYPDHGKGAGFIYVSAILPSSDTSISVQVR